jgi:hypothetical protein
LIPRVGFPKVASDLLFEEMATIPTGVRHELAAFIEFELTVLVKSRWGCSLDMQEEALWDSWEVDSLSKRFRLGSQ